MRKVEEILSRFEGMKTELKVLKKIKADTYKLKGKEHITPLLDEKINMKQIQFKIILWVLADESILNHDYINLKKR